MPSVNKLFPSQYLSGEDLDGRTVTLLIKGARLETVGQGEQAEQKLVVYFKGTDKKFVLNKTNALAIAALHGDDYDMWGGKRISIHPVIVTAFGKTAPAVRVLDRIVDPAPATNPVPAQPARQAQSPKQAYAGVNDNPFNEPGFGDDEEDGEDIPF